MSVMKALLTGCVAGCFLMASFGAHAEEADEFACEVMTVEGNAVAKSKDGAVRPLKEGDLIKAGDWIEVGSESFVDVAYDREWTNVARIEENTKTQVRSIVPSALDLEKGAIFTKLNSLPKDSSFEVKTPTALAAVRGTEFRAIYGKNGSEVFNFSDDQVYVYGLDEKGDINAQLEPLVLEKSRKAQLFRRGQLEFRAVVVNPEDMARGRVVQERLGQRLTDVQKMGRVGKVQNLERMNKFVADKIGRGEFKRPEERFPGMKMRGEAPPQAPSGAPQASPGGPSGFRPSGQPQPSPSGPGGLRASGGPWPSPSGPGGFRPSGQPQPSPSGPGGFRPIERPGEERPTPTSGGYKPPPSQESQQGQAGAKGDGSLRPQSGGPKPPDQLGQGPGKPGQGEGQKGQGKKPKPKKRLLQKPGAGQGPGGGL